MISGQPSKVSGYQSSLETAHRVNNFQEHLAHYHNLSHWFPRRVKNVNLRDDIVLKHFSTSFYHSIIFSTCYLYHPLSRYQFLDPQKFKIAAICPTHGIQVQEPNGPRPCKRPLTSARAVARLRIMAPSPENTAHSTWAIEGSRFKEVVLEIQNPSRELTYPTWGNGTSSSKCHFLRIC